MPIRRRHRKHTGEYCSMVTLKYYYYSLSKRFVFFLFTREPVYLVSQGLHKFIDDRSHITLPQFNTYNIANSN